MKKTALAMIVSFSAFCACDIFREDITVTTQYRVIKNTSSYVVDLTIKANNNYEYQLDMGDSVIFEGYCESGAGYKYCEVGWNGSEPISGRIVFADEREIIYISESCENGRNLLNPLIWELHNCGYYNENNDGDGTIEYIYEITDADYEIAVPIEK